MIRAAITLAALVLMAGCKAGRPVPEAAAQVGNGYSVERLFTHDGCTVYRFLDYGDRRYFTRCDGAASAEVFWKEACGKTCSRQMSVPTERGKERP